MKLTLSWQLREGLSLSMIFKCSIELPNPEVCDATGDAISTTAGGKPLVKDSLNTRFQHVSIPYKFELVGFSEQFKSNVHFLHIPLSHSTNQ